MSYAQWLPILVVATFLPAVPLIFLIKPIEKLDTSLPIPWIFRSGSTLAFAFSLDTGRRLLILSTGNKIIPPNYAWQSAVFLSMQGIVAISLWIRLGLELNSRWARRDRQNRFPRGGE